MFMVCLFWVKWYKILKLRCLFALTIFAIIEFFVSSYSKIPYDKIYF